MSEQVRVVRLRSSRGVSRNNSRYFRRGIELIRLNKSCLEGIEVRKRVTLSQIEVNRT